MAISFSLALRLRRICCTDTTFTILVEGLAMKPGNVADKNDL